MDEIRQVRFCGASMSCTIVLIKHCGFQFHVRLNISNKHLIWSILYGPHSMAHFKWSNIFTLFNVAFKSSEMNSMIFKNFFDFLI